MPYCQCSRFAGPHPPPDSGIRNFPQPWRNCHSQQGSADQLSQCTMWTMLTMWQYLSQLSQLTISHVALHQCTKWITMCNCLIFEQLWQLSLRMRGGSKKGSFSNFTHLSLYPFSVTVVTVDAPWLIQCAWCSAAQKVWIILQLGVDNVNNGTILTMWTTKQE